jgi:hypothetical protein
MTPRLTHDMQDVKAALNDPSAPAAPSCEGAGLAQAKGTLDLTPSQRQNVWRSSDPPAAWLSGEVGAITVAMRLRGASRPRPVSPVHRLSRLPKPRVVGSSPIVRFGGIAGTSRLRRRRQGGGARPVPTAVPTVKARVEVRGPSRALLEPRTMTPNAPRWPRHPMIPRYPRPQPLP